MKRATPLFILFCIAAGCFAPKPVAQTKQTFTFDYTPKESNRAGSASMLVALIRPRYADEFASTGSSELFRNFQTAMGNDVEELIVSKGFSLKGPYQAFDELIFEDKKNTSILIHIEIAPQFTAHEGSWRTHSSVLGAKYTSYSYSGTVSLVGKINLSGVEPLTNEKIWTKSVLIPDVQNIIIETSGRYSRVLNEIELLGDPAVYNSVGKALKAQYTGIMDKIAAHFNVEEFATLKGQIKELKSKKGF